jgi:tetratricopeptide (TPR) repeat protein
MGLCYYSMGEFAHSLTCFEEALGLNAAYEKAASWRDKVLQELANAKANAAPAPPMVTSVVVEEGESSADE